jgi:hypothetical protein
MDHRRIVVSGLMTVVLSSVILFNVVFVSLGGLSTQGSNLQDPKSPNAASSYDLLPDTFVWVAPGDGILKNHTEKVKGTTTWRFEGSNTEVLVKLEYMTQENFWLFYNNLSYDSTILSNGTSFKDNGTVELPYCETWYFVFTNPQKNGSTVLQAYVNFVYCEDPDNNPTQIGLSMGIEIMMMSFVGVVLAILYSIRKQRVSRIQ